jgi:Ca2+/H+ antiporter
MQSKKYSLIEAVTNTSIGFIISLICGMLVYPVYFPEVKFHQTFELILIFTAISIIRVYITRRFFNKKTVCDNCNQFTSRIVLDEHESY